MTAPSADHPSGSIPASALLPVSHSILERPSMQFRPFGVDEQGKPIRDVSGVLVAANLLYLEESVSQGKDSDRASAIGEQLCHLLNERIPDPVYHVTPVFLKNSWHSYSYEFVCYLREFCQHLSGDPDFHYKVPRAKMFPPAIQVLGRPFTLAQIYKMWSHFGQKYTKGCIIFGVGRVTGRSAVLRSKFTDHAYAQFGPYRKRCAQMVCQVSKGGLAAIPEKARGLPCARVNETQCIVNGDAWCEWEFIWEAEADRTVSWWIWGAATVAIGWAFLSWRLPALAAWEALLVAGLPAAVAGLAAFTYTRRQLKPLQDLVNEQEQTVEARHEELREAHLEHEHTTVELRRSVHELTTLQQASLMFSSTHQLDELVDRILDTIVHELRYDRAMISFFDPARSILHRSHVLGVSPEVEAYVQTHEIPVTDPRTIAGRTILRGEAVFAPVLHEQWELLHPIEQELARRSDTAALISVPLKAQDTVLGCLAVGRAQAGSLTDADRNLMITMANQVAIAVANVQAYGQIETMNLGLEARVQERTAALEAANEKLQEMDRLKSQFLAHVSHELRTPLTSITGFAENMLEGLAGPITERQTQYLTKIKTNGTRLARMITHLLDRSRIEAGKIELSLSKVSLVELAREVVGQIQPLAAAKQQHLQIVDEGESIMIRADADRLSQVLTNLLDNAVKYTPDGGVVSLDVRRQDDHWAAVTVTNSGPGIPQEALPRLFDPFFRVSQQERSRVKGLGLGLSIARELVELHGGAIRVSSEAGRTQFRFTVPLETIATPPSWSTAPGLVRILVVDDDPDIVQLLKDRLEADGYAVLVATDGQQALDVLADTHVDGLILDIGMPVLDGLEVLSHIRRTRLQIPVIMVTAVEARERALLAMETGAQAYLLKPFDGQQLRQVVKQWFQPEGARS